MNKKKPSDSDEKNTLKQGRFVGLIEVLVLLAIVGSGVAVRFEDMSAWEKTEISGFYNGQPVMSSHRGWYYMLDARQMLEGGSFFDLPYRDGKSVSGFSSPPLISVLTAGISRFMKVDLSWVGAVIPIFLGCLAALPVYLLCRSLAGVTAAMIAAGLTIFYPFYLQETAFGRLDTACLNAAVAVTIIYLLLQFASIPNKKRYIFLTGALAVFYLFVRWWQQAPGAAIGLFGIWFTIILVFLYRPNRSEYPLFTGILAFFIIISAGVNFGQLSEIGHMFSGALTPPAGISANAFPGVKAGVLEMHPFCTSHGLSIPLALWFHLIIGFMGFVLLFFRKPRESLMLLPLFLMGCAAFAGYSTTVFLSPVLGMGTGYLIIFVWSRLEKMRKLRAGVVSLAAIVLVITIVSQVKAPIVMPNVDGRVLKGMDMLAGKIPDNSRIWSWIPTSGGLSYYSRKDILYHQEDIDGEHAVYAAIPMGTYSFSLAANFMRFISVRGIKGVQTFYQAYGSSKADRLQMLRRILLKGPIEGAGIIAGAGLAPQDDLKTVEDWTGFFFPENRRPLYLFLDYHLTQTAYWWHWFSTYDIAGQQGRHPEYTAYPNIFVSENRRVRFTDDRHFQVDDEKGLIRFKDGKISPLSAIVIRKQGRLGIKKFEHEGFHFEMLFEERFGVFMDAVISNSVFNRLFIRQDYDNRYFEKVIDQSPYYQVWKVRDSFSQIPREERKK